MNKFKQFFLISLLVINGIAFSQNEKLRVSGFVQSLYEIKGEDNSFSLRRARLSADGKLNDIVSYKIQADFGSSPCLVDAYAKIKLNKAFSIQVGQFKLPFTIESPINPLNLVAIDYSEIVQKLAGYSDFCGAKGKGRDIGIMISGSFIHNDEQNYDLIKYSLGLFNGNAINGKDNNALKDIVGKIELCPIKSVTLSGSIYKGIYGTDELTRNRYSFGVQYDDSKLVARSEYIGGETGTGLDILSGDELIAEQNGFYGVIGYWVNVKHNDNEQKFMPYLHYENVVSDVETQSKTDYYGVGLTYLPFKFLQVRCEYNLIESSDNNKANRLRFMLNYKF